MNNTKVINISTSSSSFAMADYKSDIFKGWYAQVAYQLRKKMQKIELECWAPERKYKKEFTKINQGVKFRIFPSTLSVRHGMEFSMPLISALNNEILLAEKKNTKLIIHLHEYHSWLTYSILFFAKKSENLKIIAQHHGGRSPFENLRRYKRMLLAFPAVILMQFSENLLFKRINTFYALSNPEIKYLRTIAPKSNIKFQTMGIEDEYFKRIDKKLARKKINLKEKEKYMLYLGRIKTTKGVKELLDAFKEIKDVNLLLVGEGVDYDKYKKYTLQNGITNAIFIGPVYGEKKLLYLSASDCLILPSHTEGAPVVLMEAIAKNLPVIATDVGGVNRMIKNNREGIIIPVKSKEDIKKAVIEILDWKNKNIQTYANKYKWANIIKETAKDYGLL